MPLKEHSRYISSSFGRALAHRQRAAAVQVPIFKQRRLGEATRDAVATGSPQAVVDAVVQHAMLSTRGERELFEIVDIESEVRSWSQYPVVQPLAAGARCSVLFSISVPLPHGRKTILPAHQCTDPQAVCNNFGTAGARLNLCRHHTGQGHAGLAVC